MWKRHKNFFVLGPNYALQACGFLRKIHHNIALLRWACKQDFHQIGGIDAKEEES